MPSSAYLYYLFITVNLAPKIAETVVVRTLLFATYRKRFLWPASNVKTGKRIPLVVTCLIPFLGSISQSSRVIFWSVISKSLQKQDCHELMISDCSNFKSYQRKKSTCIYLFFFTVNCTRFIARYIFCLLFQHYYWLHKQKKVTFWNCKKKKKKLAWSNTACFSNSTQVATQVNFSDRKAMLKSCCTQM